LSFSVTADYEASGRVEPDGSVSINASIDVHAPVLTLRWMSAHGRARTRVLKWHRSGITVDGTPTNG